MKRNIVFNLLNRSYKICNSYKLITTEFHRIKSILMKNGYPGWFVDKCIYRFMDRKHQTQSSDNAVRESGLYVVAKLPFLGSISHHIQKESCDFVQQKISIPLGLRVIHTSNKLSSNFPLKDGQQQLNRAGVVYKLSCSCGATYVGQTMRNLCTRLDEH